MIDLINLVKVAPLPEEQKLEILRQMDSFSPSKKLEIIELCWHWITQDYESKIDYEYERMMYEMGMGVKEYNKDDFMAIEDKFYQELLEKLQAAGDEEKMTEVREKLGIQQAAN